MLNRKLCTAWCHGGKRGKNLLRFSRFPFFHVSPWPFISSRNGSRVSTEDVKRCEALKIARPLVQAKPWRNDTRHHFVANVQNFFGWNHFGLDLLDLFDLPDLQGEFRCIILLMVSCLVDSSVTPDGICVAPGEGWLGTWLDIPMHINSSYRLDRRTHSKHRYLGHWRPERVSVDMDVLDIVVLCYFLSEIGCSWWDLVRQICSFSMEAPRACQV